MLKILIVDNSPLHIHGLLGCLNALSFVDGTDHCATYEELHLKLERDKPDLVFLELNLGSAQQDGFAECQNIVRKYPSVFVAILSKYNSDACIKKAHGCGARAYFDKHCEMESILTFLVQIDQGTVIPFHVDVVTERIRRPVLSMSDGFELKQTVSPREGEVMSLMLADMAPKDIQTKLGISYETFRSHHKAILNKLGLKSDVALGKFAITHNLIK